MWAALANSYENNLSVTKLFEFDLKGDCRADQPDILDSGRNGSPECFSLGSFNPARLACDYLGRINESGQFLAGPEYLERHYLGILSPP